MERRHANGRRRPDHVHLWRCRQRRVHLQPANYRPSGNAQASCPRPPHAPAPIILKNNRDLFCEYYSEGKVIKSRDSFHAMPDIGYFKGKSLYLAGRGDEVLNFSGNKLSFSSIEMVLRELSGVDDVG